jgi:restriction endonuclease Mrr
MASQSLIFLVLVAGAVGFLLILLVGRGQRLSPASPAGQGGGDVAEIAWVRPHGVDGFERLLLRVFEEMGFQPGPCEKTDDTVAFWAIDPTPIRGGRIYVHGIFSPPGVAVDGDDVRGLADASRAELAGKAVLVTVGRFSDDARDAARDQPIDLVDGEALAELVRRYLPQAHATQTP